MNEQIKLLVAEITVMLVKKTIEMSLEQALKEVGLLLATDGIPVEVANGLMVMAIEAYVS